MLIAMALNIFRRLICKQVYLNIVLDDALEEKPGGEKARIGMVVIRGNAVVMLEVCTPKRQLLEDSLFLT